MKHIEADRLLVASWCDGPEAGAVEQADFVETTAELSPLGVIKG
jgi:hypothetical protein